VQPPTKEIFWKWLDHLDHDPGSFLETLGPDERISFLWLCFSIRLGKLKEDLHKTSIVSNLDGLDELFGFMLALTQLIEVQHPEALYLPIDLFEATAARREVKLISFPLRPHKEKAWAVFCTALIQSVNALLYNLYVISNQSFQETERFASAKWLADKIWGKRIDHRNPTTNKIIRSLLASSGQTVFFDVWRPHAIYLSIEQSRGKRTLKGKRDWPVYFDIWQLRQAQPGIHLRFNEDRYRIMELSC
jgi:hypothetical protein